MKEIADVFKNKPVIEAAALITLMAMLAIFASTVNHKTAYTFSELSQGYTLVIDAGHGGMDGGAVGVDGSKESDINLAVALKLEALAEFMGCKTVMSRRDDSGGSGLTEHSEHKELVYRTELVKSALNPVYLGIHQNCYPTAQPSGTQVIFSQNGNSESFGKLMHDLLVQKLDPSNRRVAQPDKNKLYVLSNVECPAILVECGFISNHSDITKLTDSAYQRALCTVMLSAYLQFININTSSTSMQL